MSVNININNDVVEINEVNEVVQIVVTGGIGPAGPTGQGVPVGGTTGQALVKLTSTNFDTTWSSIGVGTVTSVNLTAGTGINVSGGPVTTSGNINVVNTAPDQVVALSGAGTSVITGTYPNFTVTSNDQFNGTVTSVGATAGTGITISGSPITTSGTLTITNNAPDQVVALTGSGTTTISGTYPNFTISSADSNVGTVTSVNMTVPTGLTISGNPITSAGTLALALASGFSIPTTASQSTWDTAYNDSIVSAAVTGTATKTLTLTQQDAGTITASWSDIDTGLTSVGVSMPSAFSVVNSPLTANGTIAITGAGNALQYIDGTGALQTFPLLTGYVPYTGATTNVNLGIYNLTAASLIKSGGTSGQFLKADGSVDSSAYIVLSSLSATSPLSYNNTTGVFTISQASTSTNGYLSSTDWNTFNSKQATLSLTTIGSSGAATLIGATLNIPNYANLVTSVFGRTGAVVATEGDYSLTQLSDVTITTPSSGQVLKYNGTLWVNDSDTGITSLNGLTALTQTFAVGTSGTDFGISSATSTHTFNLPTASALNRGALASADFTTFNNKQNTLSLTTTGTSGAATLVGATLNIPNYANLVTSVFGRTGVVVATNGDYTTTQVTEGTNLYFLDSRARSAISAGASISYNSTTGVITNSAPDQVVGLTASTGISVSGTYPNFTITNTQPSSGGTVTSVAALTIGTSGTDLSSTVATSTSTPVITLNVPTASAINRGVLSSADFTTFNSKQTALNGTGFVKISGTTISYDNSTYYLASNPNGYNTGTVTSVGLSSATSGVTIGSTPITTSGTITLAIATATTSQNGLLSSTDWTTFNNKQAAGNYITALTGEVTASGPGSVGATMLNSAVTGKVLTGLNLVGGGTIVGTDTILQAFGKTQNQISALVGGVMYEGVWNATTNTPAIVSSVGSKGDYYVVNVAGSTSIDGITDWKVGDWIIFNGTTWDKVDNTDAVSSVNGFLGAVSLTTANISEVTNLYYTQARFDTAFGLKSTSNLAEGTNLYFTNARAIASTLTGYTSGAGVISATDTILGAIQKLNGNIGALTTGVSSVFGRTGAVVATSGDYTTAQVTESGSLYFTDSRARLALSFVAGSGAYNSTTGVITIPTNNNQITNGAGYTTNVGTVTSVGLSSATSGVTIGSTPVTTSGTITLAIATATTSQNGLLSSADWTTFNNKQSTITLTTTGTSGAATFSANTLNIPNYGSALSGYLPLTGGTLTGALSGTSASFSAASGNQILLAEATTGTNASYMAFKNTGQRMFVGIDNSTGTQILGSGNPYQGVISMEGARDLVLATSGIARLTIASTGAATFSSSVKLFDELRVRSSVYTSNFNTRLTSDGGANGILQLGNNGTNYILAGNTSAGGYLIFRVNCASESITAGTEALTLASTGAATFSSSVQIGSTSGGAVLTTANAGTNAIYQSFQNTGGTSYIGLEQSAGGNLITGSTGYDLVFRGQSGIGFSANNGASVNLRIASTGAATFSSTVLLSNSVGLLGRNNANTGNITLIQSTSADKVQVDPSGFGLIMGGTLGVTGAATFSSSVVVGTTLKTSNTLAGSSAQPFRVGSVTAGVVVLTNMLEIEINGTSYNIPISTGFN